MWHYIANEILDKTEKYQGIDTLSFRGEKTDPLILPNAENVVMMS